MMMRMIAGRLRRHLGSPATDWPANRGRLLAQGAGGRIGVRRPGVAGETPLAFSISTEVDHGCPSLMLAASLARWTKPP
jgi:hypothetical protein